MNSTCPLASESQHFGGKLGHKKVKLQLKEAYMTTEKQQKWEVKNDSYFQLPAPLLLSFLFVFSMF